MEIGTIIPHIEALIFASDKPLTSMELTELINNAFGFMEEKLTLEQIQTALDGIMEKYASEFYPFEVKQSGGGWQFLTKKDFHKTVAQINGDKFLKRLSSAALETLAIIAYKQPITKGEIEAIRGVSSDYSIQKLLEKELIVIMGRNEDMPGKPLIYSTSKSFMDYFGINTAADLPKLKEIFSETMIEPTIINHGPGETLPAESTEEVIIDESDVTLVVGEDGQLIVNEETDEAVENAGPEEGSADDMDDSTGGADDENENDADQQASDSEAQESKKHDGEESDGEKSDSEEPGEEDPEKPSQP